MTRRFLVYLDSDDSAVTYSCVHCRAHLADYRYLISKSFQGSQGRAYLFEKIVNVKSSTAEDRLLLTGHHRVADIYCICCDTLLGWKYEKAFEPSQRYKEGKYIIELIHIIKDNQWDTFLTPHTKRRSSGYSTEHFDNPGLAPLSQGACGQQNGGFVDSSTDLIEPALPSSVQGAAPCSSLPNPAHLSSAFAEPEESSLFNSDESPLAERLGQLQQTELSEPTVIPHADLIPRLIQQSALPQVDGDEISYPRSSSRSLNIFNARASPPEHLSLFLPQKSPSKPKKQKHLCGAVTSIGSTLRIASSSSCTLTEPLLDADTRNLTFEPEMTASFLSTVVDDSSDPNQRSSARPSESHHSTMLLLPPSDSALTVLAEVVSPTGDSSDNNNQLNDEAFNALD